jgi:hypothetical protein
MKMKSRHLLVLVVAVVLLQSSNSDSLSLLSNRLQAVQQPVALFQDLLVQLHDKMAQTLQQPSEVGDSGGRRRRPLIEKLLDALHAMELEAPHFSNRARHGKIPHPPWISWTVLLE